MPQELFKPPSSPLYSFPMDDRSLALIGMVTLLWGQIDNMVDTLLTKIYALNEDQFKSLFGTKTLPPKAQALKVATDRCDNEQHAKIIEEMCDAIFFCASDRNILTHGLWGWEWREKENLYYSCAKSANKNRTFYLGDLLDLYEKVNAAAIKSDYALSIVSGRPVFDTRNRVTVFSDKPPPAPPPRFAR